MDLVPLLSRQIRTCRGLRLTKTHLFTLGKAQAVHDRSGKKAETITGSRENKTVTRQGGEEEVLCLTWLAEMMNENFSDNSGRL